MGVAGRGRDLNMAGVCGVGLWGWMGFYGAGICGVQIYGAGICGVGL